MKKTSDRSLLLFGSFIVACAGSLIILLCFHSIPSENKDIVNVSLGTFLTLASGVVGYYFGSSKGSTEKMEAIKNMQPIPDNSITISENKELPVV